VSPSLDVIDLNILRELQNEGRLTNVELAGRIGISPPPCLRRVRALRQVGFIKGFRALLDQKLLGYDRTVFVMGNLANPSEGNLQAFEELVRGQPLVRQCWMLSGETDFLLICVAPDLPSVQIFISELSAAPHVHNVKTALALKITKDAPLVPL
jgi:DNA-binding Lrp family transcriptional regulator